MKNNFFCQCGHGPGTKDKIKKHIYASMMSEPGKHKIAKSVKQSTVKEPAIPAAKPAEVKPVAPQLPKPKRTGTIYLVLCILSGIVGLALFAGYCITLNLMFGYTFMVPMGLAWFNFYQFKKSRDRATEVIHARSLIPKTQVNSMNLYPRNNPGIKRGILFEDTEEPQGQPWVCDNDGKPYFVDIFEQNKLNEFLLPDIQYYDPRLYAERVLSLPAHRRIFLRKQTLLQKLSPFFMIIIIGVEWLIIITTTSPKG